MRIKFEEIFKHEIDFAKKILKEQVDMVVQFNLFCDRGIVPIVCADPIKPEALAILVTQYRPYAVSMIAEAFFGKNPKIRPSKDKNAEHGLFVTVWNIDKHITWTALLDKHKEIKQEIIYDSDSKEIKESYSKWDFIQKLLIA